ncbi:hypothetical protein BLNAU_24040 [Blattamonas nauphoetae]|uniref:Uncharacterized protein n=1 Tax=Blattamonas nauphoetae TaxID=2049346 RepID=A0ABQ9WPI6_9EUKA|nr:hypothetical protein BLNAU_24040 [Blattamonas nauphoetae]
MTYFQNDTCSLITSSEHKQNDPTGQSKDRLLTSSNTERERDVQLNSPEIDYSSHKHQRSSAYDCVLNEMVRPTISEPQDRTLSKFVAVHLNLSETDCLESGPRWRIPDALTIGSAGQICGQPAGGGFGQPAGGGFGPPAEGRS